MKQNTNETIYDIRLADMSELDDCFEIIRHGRAFQEEQGFIQWTDSYPTYEMIREDIALSRGYVITVNSKLAGYMCIEFGGEPLYDNIDGAWEKDAPFAVMHRMAFHADYRGKGMSDIAFALLEQVCMARGIWYIRVDTDAFNKRMLHIFEKNGYTYRGKVIYPGDQGEKIAYDKSIPGPELPGGPIVKRVAVLSDTHNVLRPEVMQYLQGVDLIIHAGDFAKQSILDDLKVFAPVIAVRGNNDWSMDEDLPLLRIEELEGHKFLITHDVKSIPEEMLEGIDVIIFGHSHQYMSRLDPLKGQIWLNPGSCGKKRFDGKLSFVMMELEAGETGIYGIAMHKIDIAD